MQEKVKCAVYKNEEEWGGGHYFIPAKNYREIQMILRKEGFKIAKTPIGIFEFEKAFLDQVLGRNTHIFENMTNSKEDFIFWDNNWCI